MLLRSPRCHLDPRSVAAVGRVLVRCMGGSRPGGMPTFNWKQRKALGLSKENISAKEVLKRHDVSSEEELSKIVASIGGRIVSLKADDDYSESDEVLANTHDQLNTRKKIRVSLLFGPQKATSRGFLPEKCTKDAWRIRHNVWLSRTRYGQV